MSSGPMLSIFAVTVNVTEMSWMKIVLSWPVKDFKFTSESEMKTIPLYTSKIEVIYRHRATFQGRRRGEGLMPTTGAGGS